MDAPRHCQQPLILDRLQVGFLDSSGSSQKSQRSEVWDRRVVCDQDSSTLVVAPSGTGKTTLLRCILGLISPDSGQVLLDSQPTPPLRHPAWAGLRSDFVSFVLQDHLLVGGLTAAANLRLNPIPVAGAIGLAERLGIAHRLNAPVETLSTGQQQRLAICRALARPFRVLLLDEPFSHLDASTATLAADCIHEVAARNQAAILCTALSENTPIAADHILHL